MASNPKLNYGRPGEATHAPLHGVPVQHGLPAQHGLPPQHGMPMHGAPMQGMGAGITALPHAHPTHHVTTPQGGTVPATVVGPGQVVVGGPGTVIVDAAAAAAHQSGSGLIDVSRVPVEHAFAVLVTRAVAMGSSDLFICGAEQHVAVQVRHLGVIRPIAMLTAEEGRRLIAYIRNGSGADVNERRRPSDGRWIYRPEADAQNPSVVDLRINFLPSMYGDDVAIRLLVRSNAVMELGELGMSADQRGAYTQMIDAPSGLILITGPTGSGKTATLYASLRHLNTGERKIHTIEDPVEYAIEGLHQSQVNPAIELGFAELLRAVMRQSPDVIMIGEIRDEDTARIAVRAANSGILVLATLHAPDAASAVQSMRAFGVPNHFLAASLRGIASQRLIRTLDPESRLAFDVSDAPETFAEIRHLLGPDEGKVLYAHMPTPQNHMSGYTGRAGVFELLTLTKATRGLIADGAAIESIRDQARADGMLPFRTAGLLNVARGVTSAEELFRVIPAEHLLVDF